VGTGHGRADLDCATKVLVCLTRLSASGVGYGSSPLTRIPTTPLRRIVIVTEAMPTRLAALTPFLAPYRARTVEVGVAFQSVP
jgi:hypothetical protein